MGAHGERYDIEATKRRRSVGVRLVRKAKIFSGAGGRARGLCCGGGRVGARAIVFDKRVFVKRSFERAWVSALAALARGRRTCARALSARVWAWARAATKHGATNTAAYIVEEETDEFSENSSVFTYMYLAYMYLAYPGKNWTR